MALIEIDGLPFLIAWWIFPWRTVSHNQMVAPLKMVMTGGWLIIVLPTLYGGFILW